MKNSLKGLTLFFAVVLGSVHAARAQISPSPVGGSSYTGNFVSQQPGLAYSTAPAMDLAAYDTSRISAEMIYSSVTFSAVSVPSGKQSTGTITVLSYAGLSSATATNQMTVVSTQMWNGAYITVNGTNLYLGQQWSRATTSSVTASNIATAIHTAFPLISAAANASGVIFATATYGTAGNAYTFASSTGAITVAALRFTGGQDNATITINGTALTANTDFYPATSNAITATRLSTKINSAFAGLITSTCPTGTAVVYATSTFNGTAYNYTLATTSATAASVSAATMVGGSNPGLTLNSQVFSTPGTTGLTLALPVVYAVGTATAAGGLTNGTTFYAVPKSATSFYLAKYSTSALAGLSADYVTVTSTSSGIVINNYTFTPIAWSGSATFIWQASDDGSTYATAPSTGTVTITSNTAATVSLIDFGVFNYRYLRLNYTAPTFGALSIKVPVYIKQDGIGRF